MTVGIHRIKPFNDDGNVEKHGLESHKDVPKREASVRIGDRVLVKRMEKCFVGTVVAIAGASCEVLPDGEERTRSANYQHVYLVVSGPEEGKRKHDLQFILRVLRGFGQKWLKGSKAHEGLEILLNTLEERVREDFE